MISIVDYGMGNLNSIANMLKRSGHEARLCSTVEEIDAATRLILPGVGAYDAGMASLEELGLLEVLSRKVIAESTPVLGICLGMQLLLEGSEEGERPGLGWIRGRCVRFDFDGTHDQLKIPHMGWNAVEPASRGDLFADMDEDAGYYFVHSFHALCDDESDVLGWTTHGYRFASALRHGNIMGTQFHPEKSHKHGMRLLARFAELSC